MLRKTCLPRSATVGDVVASWLVYSSCRWSTAVQVHALAGGWGHCVEFLGKTLKLSVPLSTQEYKWVLANCWGKPSKLWGVTYNGLDSHPRGAKILLAASCYRNCISSSSYEPIGFKDSYT